MKPYSISITLFSLLLILPYHLAGAPVFIEETCMAAMKIVSTIDYNFCESTLNPNHTLVAIVANTTRDFANISATATATHAHSVTAMIQDLLRTSPDPVTNSSLKLCNGTYHHVASSLDEAVVAINEKHDDLAKSSLNQGVIGIISCEAEFEKFRKPSPLIEMDTVSVKLVTLTYAILEVVENNK